MKKILLLAIIPFWISIPLFAYQFEDYQWGTSRKNVEKLLREKKQSHARATVETITYSNNIFNEACSITLVFTPKSSMLAGITVSWNTISVGRNLKRLLPNKYGDPQQPHKSLDKYIWSNDSQGEKIILEYSVLRTILAYFGGEDYKRYKQEKEETQKELNIF